MHKTRSSHIPCTMSQKAAFNSSRERVEKFLIWIFHSEKKEVMHGEEQIKFSYETLRAILDPKTRQCKLRLCRNIRNGLKCPIYYRQLMVEVIVRVRTGSVSNICKYCIL